MIEVATASVGLRIAPSATPQPTEPRDEPHEERATSGMPGIKLTQIPASTRMSGAGILSLGASAAAAEITSCVTTNRRMIFCMLDRVRRPYTGPARDANVLGSDARHKPAADGVL